MAETENKDKPTFPSKRKLDPLDYEEEENQSNKYQMPQLLSHNDISVPNEEKVTGNPALEAPGINSSSNCSIAEEKTVSIAQAEESAVGKEYEEEEEEEDTDFEDEEGEENGEATSVDRKGKGIMIEEEHDDSDDEDDDDSGDGGSELDSDCDELEDDPLAEVDLDNILPSRTRRRAVQPGVYIANDLGNNEHDDSEDSDA